MAAPSGRASVTDRRQAAGVVSSKVGDKGSIAHGPVGHITIASDEKENQKNIFRSTVEH